MKTKTEILAGIIWLRVGRISGKKATAIATEAIREMRKAKR